MAEKHGKLDEGSVMERDIEYGEVRKADEEAAKRALRKAITPHLDKLRLESEDYDASAQNTVARNIDRSALRDLRRVGASTFYEIGNSEGFDIIDLGDGLVVEIYSGHNDEPFSVEIVPSDQVDERKESRRRQEEELLKGK